MVRPLRYGSGLSFEEAEDRYREVEAEFRKVQGNYSGFFSRFRRNMSDEDQRALAHCIGVLLPLAHEQAVQKQFVETHRDDALFYRIGNLQFEVSEYLAKFQNTGVHIVGRT